MQKKMIVRSGVIAGLLFLVGAAIAYTPTTKYFGEATSNSAGSVQELVAPTPSAPAVPSVPNYEELVDGVNGAARSVLPKAEERAEEPQELPVRAGDIPDIVLPVRAAYAVTVQGEELFSKNAEAPVQIASITKLLTALVAREVFPQDAVIPVSEEAVQEEGNRGQLRPGETFTVEDALRALLIVSSNDMATAIAQAFPDGSEVFMEWMNRRAAALGMKDAIFNNPHGLTPPGNIASAKGVAVLMQEAFTDEALVSMMQEERAEVTSNEGIAHPLESTNALLERVPGVVAGKTGFTDESRGTLVVVFSPLAVAEKREVLEDDPFVIAVLLGTEDRFADMEAFVRWLSAAYRFK